MQSSRLAVGMDLVSISAIAESVTRFGDRFLHRIFTQGEIDYALAAPALSSSRLAARFAAKEAVRKALRLDGVAWRDIEVVRHADGACSIALHGRTRGLVPVDSGVQIAVSLSHDGDQAAAVVIAQWN